MESKQGKIIFILSFFFILFILYECVLGQKAVDGDTFIYKGNHYRLACIDVVEWNHERGQEATDYLQAWLDKATKYEVVKIGYYGRNIVFIWSENILINAKIYQYGLADFYYNYDCKYKDLILKSNDK